MSETPDSDLTGEQYSTVGSSSRRTFMKAAAAGATAAGVGATGISGSAAAQQQIPTPPLSVEDNVFVDPEGNTVTLRGLNIIDPRRADTLAPTRGKNAVQMVDEFTDQSEGWHTHCIRVPLQPQDIARTTTGYIQGPLDPGEFSEADLEEYLEDHVDPIVDLCEERGVYVILDYHRHWTGGDTEFSGEWDTDMPLQEECVMFWDVVGQRYGDRDHTLWEVYNEPTQPGMWGDPFDSHWAGTWFEFVEFIQPAIDQIAEHTDRPVLLGSPSWTQSPEGILLTEDDVPDYMQDDFVQIDEPENLAMTYHIYAGHQASQEQNWEDASLNGQGVEGVWEEYPLVVTEFGWDEELEPMTQDNPLGGTVESFGDPFIEWMESEGRHEAISWTAWCADIWWDPTMFRRGFEGSDSDIENPYEADVPEDCPDLPCEWELAGQDFGDYNSKMGLRIKEELEAQADHNNPGATSGPTPPASPSNVEAEATGETEIVVTWDAVTDADAYNVSLDGDHYDETTDTTYTIADLEPGTTYEVGVAAENAAGTSLVSTTNVTTQDGDGEHPCEAAGADMETLSNGNTVCDLDGDGKYRDLTGSGDTTTQDLQYFFENQHREPYDSRTDLFDFTDNDNVGQPDVVDLFHAI